MLATSDDRVRPRNTTSLPTGGSRPPSNVTYDWKIHAEKPLLRRLTVLLRPIFAANHRWAMDRGEESLRLELARRRARTGEERARVPPPPAPTTRSPLPLALAAAAVIAAGAGVVYLVSR